MKVLVTCRIRKPLDVYLVITEWPGIPTRVIVKCKHLLLHSVSKPAVQSHFCNCDCKSRTEQDHVVTNLHSQPRPEDAGRAGDYRGI